MQISNWLIKLVPALKEYKPGVEFLSRLFFLIVLGLILKKFYWLVSNEAGTLLYPPLEGLNPIESLRMSLIWGAKKGIDLLGYPSFSAGWLVGIIGVANVSLQTPCLGINVCLAFMALIIAYPSSWTWWKSAIYLALGLVVIQLVNLVRIIAMVFVVKNRYQLPVEHHDLFNLVVYLIIFSLFYIYTTKPKV